MNKKNVKKKRKQQPRIQYLYIANIILSLIHPQSNYSEIFGIVCYYWSQIKCITDVFDYLITVSESSFVIA